jgi:tetratricopeptide (TPR) repeat protein
VRPRSRLRRGFIFIFFGSRGIVSNDSAAPIKQRCPRCGRETELVAKRYRNWFTLFFIPVFPISAPRKFIQCVSCGAQFPLAGDAVRATAEASDAQQTQQAIGLYNSLRASPANSITLNQLMMLYASLKEYDQAISAAADFPQALNASEQCMTTLARVYLAQNKLPEALQWLGAAIERNPHLGEAHYYKGVAHMLTTPPDLAAAVAAARASRNAGYPDAEVLLRQAEEKAREAQT